MIKRGFCSVSEATLFTAGKVFFWICVLFCVVDIVGFSWGSSRRGNIRQYLPDRSVSTSYNQHATKWMQYNRTSFSNASFYLTSIKSTTTTSPTIDIDAELARREERAKRFGGAFDREQCREQLLKQQQQVAAVSLRETRRARFGASDAEKKQQREARFGATKANAESVDDAVKAARIAKFGQVDMSRFERKRSQPLARGRKSRRFH